MKLCSDATEEDATEEDETEEDATEEDATEEDATEEDATEEDATEEDSTEEDATHLPSFCKLFFPPLKTEQQFKFFLEFVIGGLPLTRRELSLISGLEYLRARLKPEESICQLFSLKICDL